MKTQMNLHNCTELDDISFILITVSENMKQHLTKIHKSPFVIFSKYSPYLLLTELHLTVVSKPTEACFLNKNNHRKTNLKNTFIKYSSVRTKGFSNYFLKSSFSLTAQ